MAEHNELGVKGEEIALQHLKNNHYQILSTNWRWQKAEVDIIAVKDNCLIVIEVKTRSYDGFMKPEESVTEKKQELLIEAAEAYCEIHSIDLEIRFDIISIILNQSKSTVKHIEGAF